MVSENTLQVLFKYWEKFGGVDFFDPTPFKIFNIDLTPKNMAEIAKKYYGEKNLENKIKEFIGKQYNISSLHYNFDYIINNLDILNDKLISTEISINPNSKIKVSDNLTITFQDLMNTSDAEEFMSKFYPNIKPDDPSYETMVEDLNYDFFFPDAGFFDSVEELLLSNLERHITRYYGYIFDYISFELGNESQFTSGKSINETIFRVKQLIKFSDY